MVERTIDTNMKIDEGDEVFFNEATGGYFETWTGMVKNCFRKHDMSKGEIRDALNLEALDEIKDEAYGYLYMTTYSK